MNHRWLQWRRWWVRRHRLDEPYRTFIDSGHLPPTTAFENIEFVALDVETTGLDPASAEMLSVGWVVLRNGRVDLGSAESHIVRPSGDVGSSAAVHGLTDTMVGQGQDRAVIIARTIEALTGRVLLVHHAGLDKALLDRLCREQFGAPLLLPVVDTLALEHQRRRRRHHVGENHSLRLADLRESYNLPPYVAHDCLVDAIATAELLVAMVAHNDGTQKTCLGDLMAF